MVRQWLMRREQPREASALGRPSTRSGTMLVLIQRPRKDQAVADLEAGLPRSPAAAPAGDIGTALFKSEQRFFLNRNPPRRRNSQTALCETLTPRAASSSFSACSVKCGVWFSRFTMNTRCGSSTGLR